MVGQGNTCLGKKSARPDGTYLKIPQDLPVYGKIPERPQGACGQEQLYHLPHTPKEKDYRDHQLQGNETKTVAIELPRAKNPHRSCLTACTVFLALPLAIAPPKLCLHNVALCLHKWHIITLCKIATKATNIYELFTYFKLKSNNPKPIVCNSTEPVTYFLKS